MSKKPVPFETVHKTLTTLVEKIDESYSLSVDQSLEESDETKRALTKADGYRYDHISNALWDIIYQLESWMQT